MPGFQLERSRAFVSVVEHVADPVDRTGVDRLDGQRCRHAVEAAVSQHADVGVTAVGLDEIVGHVEQVVIVEINGSGSAGRVLGRPGSW